MRAGAQLIKNILGALTLHFLRHGGFFAFAGCANLAAKRITRAIGLALLAGGSLLRQPLHSAAQLAQRFGLAGFGAGDIAFPQGLFGLAHGAAGLVERFAGPAAFGKALPLAGDVIAERALPVGQFAGRGGALAAGLALF